MEKNELKKGFSHKTKISTKLFWLSIWMFLIDAILYFTVAQGKNYSPDSIGGLAFRIVFVLFISFFILYLLFHIIDRIKRKSS